MLFTTHDITFNINIMIYVFLGQGSSRGDRLLLFAKLKNLKLDDLGKHIRSPGGREGGRSTKERAWFTTAHERPCDVGSLGATKARAVGVSEDGRERSVVRGRPVRARGH